MKHLIVALGSPFGADKAAWLLMDELDKLKNENLTLFKSSGNGTDWFHELDNHQQVIFIDAALSALPIGDFVMLPHDVFEQEKHKSTHSTHGLQLSESIALAKNIGLLTIPYKTFIISIGASIAQSNQITINTLNFESMSQVLINQLSFE